MNYLEINIKITKVNKFDNTLLISENNLYYSSDTSKSLGYTIIIDMRGNGNNMGSVKTILKILQENFCSIVHSVVIIKPENFWHKQRTTIASHKYKFEVYFC